MPMSSFGESSCPRCSARLWHLCLPCAPRFLVCQPGESIYQAMASLAGSRRGFSAKELEANLKEADQLDVLELLADLETAL